MSKSTNAYFCLDIGGTGTRGALFNRSGEKIAQAKAEAGALSLGAEQTHSAICSVWDQMVSSLESDDWQKNSVSIIAGVAGHGLPGRTEQLLQKLKDFPRIKIVSDGYGALLGATNGKPGALISIGTGVGALRLGEDGQTQAVSGWGFPAGDAGSGAWLGLRLLGDFLKYLDGITLTPPLKKELADILLNHIGTEPQSIMQWQTHARPKDFATLAPWVVERAQDADAYCVALLSEAAEKIARVGNALICPENNHVYLSGGLAGSLLPYCIASVNNIEWELSQNDPLWGLYLLGKGEAPEQKLRARPGLQQHGSS